MTIEPKSYHEKKGPHAFLDFENSAIDVEDAVISFGNWDRSNLKWNQAYLTSNETKAICLSVRGVSSFFRGLPIGFFSFLTILITALFNKNYRKFKVIFEAEQGFRLC